MSRYTVTLENGNSTLEYYTSLGSRVNKGQYNTDSGLTAAYAVFNLKDSTVDSIGPVDVKYLTIRGADLLEYPALLRDVRAVYDIRFEDCTLSDKVSLNTIKGLKKVSFLRCKGTYPAITADLKYLKWEKCSIDTIPEWVDRLKNLEYLSVADCEMKCRFPNGPLTLPKLHTYVVSGNQFAYSSLGLPASDALTIYGDYALTDSVTVETIYWEYDTERYYTITATRLYSVYEVIREIDSILSETDSRTIIVRQYKLMPGLSCVLIPVGMEETDKYYQYTVRDTDVDTVIVQYQPDYDVKHEIL